MSKIDKTSIKKARKLIVKSSLKNNGQRIFEK